MRTFGAILTRIGNIGRQFETPVQKVSNTVYEGFLHSYDQTMGLKSYGACVDLLVNYYYEQAALGN